jgi:phytoene synthase
LQLTNILRDLDEDAAAGGLHLPREALEDAGIAARSRGGAGRPALDRACAVAARARGISPPPAPSSPLPAPRPWPG